MFESEPPEESISQKRHSLYAEVKQEIDAAIQAIVVLKIEHKKGQEEIEKTMGTLKTISERLTNGISELEESAEWDKFTLAFFGETGVGKSTIIESLRILFSEKTRQDLLERNQQALERYEHELSEHVKQIRRALRDTEEKHAAEIKTIAKCIQNLQSIRRCDRYLSFALGMGVAALGFVVLWFWSVSS